jgi:hypothetical protein
LLVAARAAAVVRAVVISRQSAARDVVAAAEGGVRLVADADVAPLVAALADACGQNLSAANFLPLSQMSKLKPILNFCGVPLGATQFGPSNLFVTLFFIGDDGSLLPFASLFDTSSLFASLRNLPSPPSTSSPMAALFARRIVTAFSDALLTPDIPTPLRRALKFEGDFSLSGVAIVIAIENSNDPRGVDLRRRVGAPVAALNARGDFVCAGLDFF